MISWGSGTVGDKYVTKLVMIRVRNETVLIWKLNLTLAVVKNGYYPQSWVKIWNKTLKNGELKKKGKKKNVKIPSA